MDLPDGTERYVPFTPPDWYAAMQACRYAGEPFCRSHGIPYGPIVEAWALTAKSAETEAAYERERARWGR